MGKVSAISWCDHTFNGWRDCVKVSEGCANCYAETMSYRNPSVLGEWGKDAARVIGTDAYWQQPLAWDKAAEKDGVRRRVFCLSLGDVFEDRKDLIEPRIRLFELIDKTPNLDWLLLTKRPEAIRPTLIQCLDAAMDTPLDAWLLGWLGIKPPHNVWLGVTAENQARADERIPVLLKIPAAVRFVSYEPALGPVDFSPFFGEQRQWRGNGIDWHGAGMLHWIICGGESGPKARPFDLAWARATRDQCAAAGAAFFMKQFGRRAFNSEARISIDFPGSHAMAIETNDKAGADPDEWPVDLRVQQFPTPREGSHDAS